MPVFERQKLDNGLRVLTAPMPHAQSVACFVMLAAGSRYEEQSNRGIAHFAEHMFFKGTKRRPSSRALTTLVDGIGGEFNAFTSKEYTGYYVRCAGADRDTALDVLIDMIRNSKFDPEEIEREKGVILEEMNMYFDTPRDYIGSVYEGLMFGDNPLGWETLGTKDTIRGANRDTFLDYVNQWYTPDRMVVGVSGMVGKNLVPTLEKMFGRFPDNGRAKLDPAVLPAADAGPYVRLHRKQSDQAQICIGVPSLPLEHPDRYALQLLATVLGTGMSSRLFLEVRERRGLAYYVYGSNHSYTDAGSLYAQAGVDLERIDDAITVIVDQFQRMADEKVPAKELEKARSLAKGRFVLHTESPQSLLMFGLRREVLEGKALEPRRILAELDKVTAKDVQRVAQDLIDRKKLHLAVIGPFDDESRFRDLLAGRRRRKPAAKPAAKPKTTASRAKPAATAAKRRAAPPKPKAPAGRRR
jgi:predicted Zn-dependent peptidase